MNPPLSQRQLIQVGAFVDPFGHAEGPGAILLDQAGQIEVAGTPQEVGTPADVEVIDFAGHVVIPALVNAHCHLDLTPIGPQPYCGDFIKWIGQIREARTHLDPVAGVGYGAILSRRGGTAVVGDIVGAGSLGAIEALRASSLAGTAFLETFGIFGDWEQRAIVSLRAAVEVLDHDCDGIRLGLQPHAPYSCSQAVYEAANELGLPCSSHIAETPAELEFTANAAGPFAELLRTIGVWDDNLQALGSHPIEGLSNVFAARPWVLAHLNYIEAKHIALLASWNASVAYCPRASAYFGHPQGGASPHRYQAMRDADVNVALGTDSLVCLDTPDRISVLDEMRYLYRRDRTDPCALLSMATSCGARALGYVPEPWMIDRGATAGLIGLPFDSDDARPPLVQILMSDDAPCWVHGPVHVSTLDQARRL